MTEKFNFNPSPDYYTIKVPKSYIKGFSIALILLVLLYSPSFIDSSTTSLIFSTCNSTAYSTGDDFTLYCNEYVNINGTNHINNRTLPFGSLNQVVGMVNYYSGRVDYMLSQPIIPEEKENVTVNEPS